MGFEPDCCFSPRGRSTAAYISLALYRSPSLIIYDFCTRFFHTTKPAINATSTRKNDSNKHTNEHFRHPPSPPPAPPPYTPKPKPNTPPRFSGHRPLNTCCSHHTETHTHPSTHTSPRFIFIGTHEFCLYLRLRVTLSLARRTEANSLAPYSPLQNRRRAAAPSSPPAVAAVLLLLPESQSTSVPNTKQGGGGRMERCCCYLTHVGRQFLRLYSFTRRGGRDRGYHIICVPYDEKVNRVT